MPKDADEAGGGRNKRPRRDKRTAAATNDLPARYQQLLERHLAVLDRMNDVARSESAFHRLSWFGMQRSSSALAMFRDGMTVVANRRWRELASAITAAGSWILGEEPRVRRYADLGTLAAEELKRLPEGGESTTLLCRRGAQVLRLRLERLIRGPGEHTGLALADDVSEETARELEVSSLREQVQKRDQMAALGRLAAGVAHDVGNALNALALRVYSIAKVAGGHEAREHLRGMTDAIEMMRSTLDRLDRFSGRRARPVVPVALAPVVRSAVGAAGLSLASSRPRGQARVVVAVELPRRLPPVLGDPAELGNMFVNLLLNARDAMPVGGRVTVEASVDDEHVTVRVCDEGPGFPAEHLDRVFEPFFTTKGAHGTGLGLSLAYGLMQAIGGSIRAGNRPEGGAEIVLELPIAPSSMTDAGRRVRGRLGVGRHRQRLQ